MRRLLPVVAALLVGCDCGPGRLVSAEGGSVRVKLVGVDGSAVTLSIKLVGAERTAERAAAIGTLPLVSTLEALPPGSYVAQAEALNAQGLSVGAAQVPDVVVTRGAVTEIVIDLSRGLARSDEMCDGLDNDGDLEVDEGLDLPVCVVCAAGALALAPDDARCGPISCAGLDRSEVRGDVSPAGAAQCVKLTHPDLTTNRCLGPQVCAEANGSRCDPASEQVLARKGICQTMRRCEEGAPIVDLVANGTPCGSGRVCEDGACVFPDAGVPPFDAGVVDPMGCADGTREGFQSLVQFPFIAACAGGWSVPGVTSSTTPSCGRASGNTGANREGTGCSAADVCAQGWHVCRGREEVDARSPNGCEGAVPAQASADSMFFAVVQNSSSNTTCDASAFHNDVYGCGNLGAPLDPAKNCSPLNRTLASTQADTCGFSAAEPTFGPWQCLGGPTSHLEEGRVVTKAGCPQASCLSNGRPVGNWDQGGVLCCRD